MTPALRRGAACLTCLAAVLHPAFAADGDRVLREMQIHRVAELGLEIWTENQPPWDAELMAGSRGRPTFVVQSPADYYPPAVLTYVSFPAERVAPEALRTLAQTAVQRASRNYGVSSPQRFAIPLVESARGGLQGYEARFEGMANGEEVEVLVFVGHTPGRFPVAMQAYTQRGKLDHLREPIRRAWSNVRYLQ